MRAKNSIPQDYRPMSHPRSTELAPYALLVLGACSLTPATRSAGAQQVHGAAPQRTLAPAAPSERPEPPDAGTPTPTPPASTPPASASPGETPAPTATAAPPSSANTESVKPSVTFESPYLWFCMHWLHLEFDSIDCFTTLKECRAEQRVQDGPIPVPCHAQRGVVWCTLVSDPSDAEGNQRCFGYPEYCQNYRAYVAGNGLETSECTEVRTKK